MNPCSSLIASLFSLLVSMTSSPGEAESRKAEKPPQKLAISIVYVGLMSIFG